MARGGMAVPVGEEPAETIPLVEKGGGAAVVQVRIQPAE